MSHPRPELENLSEEELKQKILKLEEKITSQRKKIEELRLDGQAVYSELRREKAALKNVQNLIMLESKLTSVLEGKAGDGTSLKDVFLQVQTANKELINKNKLNERIREDLQARYNRVEAELESIRAKEEKAPSHLQAATVQSLVMDLKVLKYVHRKCKRKMVELEKICEGREEEINLLDGKIAAEHSALDRLVQQNNNHPKKTDEIKEFSSIRDEQAGIEEAFDKYLDLMEDNSTLKQALEVKDVELAMALKRESKAKDKGPSLVAPANPVQKPAQADTRNLKH